jgi:hypothetical protein
MTYPQSEEKIPSNLYLTCTYVHLQGRVALTYLWMDSIDIGLLELAQDIQNGLSNVCSKKPGKV